MNFSEEERDAYEDRLKWFRMETNTLKKAEEKGRAEMAKEMLKDNEPIEKISRYTKLTKEEIRKLKEESKK